MNSTDPTISNESTMTHPADDWRDRAAYEAWQAEVAAKFAAGPRPVDRISRAAPVALPHSFRRANRHVGNSRRDHNED